MHLRTLKADEARCGGLEEYGRLRRDCKDCLRRLTAPIDHPQPVHYFPLHSMGDPCPVKLRS